MSQGFGADPAEAERAIQNWAQDLEQKARRAAALQQEISRIRITEHSRSVTVTVDAEGVPTDVRFHDQRASGAELSAEFMAVLRRAQSRIADHVAEATKATLGDADPTTANAVTSNYRQRFPPTPASHPRLAEPASAQPEPGGPAHPGPTRVHGAHDDGDFSDETFLN
ncbi:hypothetical protein GCM10011581_10280 [Saccharopolyspora subtropica]|uniref:YbaB/EbfC DNA-binding family protein n=1 Tax=Saccharopolyspora thermophila TaxID=89367 RepID=A0A917JN95_9PSEU|nr:YbaB/EbfC family nucleoid-associated protein [Saccharopolyspora subtropica]GGI75188.1 hypothetical protein GCM10011581_10280 [Saccharopolyspora subtropica]